MIRISSISVWRNFSHHPRWIGGLVCFVVVVWIAWLINTFIISPTPTDKDIAEQTIKLDFAGLQRTSTYLENYRANVTWPTIRDNILSAPQP